MRKIAAAASVVCVLALWGGCAGPDTPVPQPGQNGTATFLRFPILPGNTFVPSLSSLLPVFTMNRGDIGSVSNNVPPGAGAGFGGAGTAGFGGLGTDTGFTVTPGFEPTFGG